MAAGGRHNPQKGWDYAKQIIQHYKDDKNIMFLCIGSASDDPSLDDCNIKYIEYIQDKMNFSLYYSASDIFFHPSMAEAFCLVIIQALSCGIPVVTFPVGIAEEAIQHKINGYIARYQDVDDLISGIDYILNLSNDKIKEIEIMSRKIVLEKFTAKIMAENYLNLFKKLI